MDLKEWNDGAGAPQTKPWLNPVAFTIEVQDATVRGRATQEAGHPTPYGLWASLGDFPLSASGVSTYAMGTYVGPSIIPGTSLYPGHTTRIKVAGSIVTGAASNIVISIRDLAGTYTYASVTLAVGGATAATPFEAEFDIQVNATGGLGVGKLRSTGRAVLGAGVVAGTFNITDNSGFDSTGGVDYSLYLSQSSSTGTNTVTRTLGVATVLY